MAAQITLKQEQIRLLERSNYLLFDEHILGEGRRIWSKTIEEIQEVLDSHRVNSNIKPH